MSRDAGSKIDTSSRAEQSYATSEIDPEFMTPIPLLPFLDVTSAYQALAWTRSAESAPMIPDCIHAGKPSTHGAPINSSEELTGIDPAMPKISTRSAEWRCARRKREERKATLSKKSYRTESTAVEDVGFSDAAESDDESVSIRLPSIGDRHDVDVNLENTRVPARALRGVRQCTRPPNVARDRCGSAILKLQLLSPSVGSQEDQVTGELLHASKSRSPRLEGDMLHKTNFI